MAQLGVRVPASLLARLDQRAADLGLNRARLTRQLLEAALQDQPAQRVAPPSTLGQALLGPLSEAELLEDWNDVLARQSVEAGADRDTALAAEAEEFDSLLSTAGEGGGTLRDGLWDAVSAAGVRRHVRQEISRRQAQQP